MEGNKKTLDYCLYGYEALIWTTADGLSILTDSVTAVSDLTDIAPRRKP